MLCRLRYPYVYGKIVLRAPRRVGMMQNPPPQKARSEAQVQTWAFPLQFQNSFKMFVGWVDFDTLCAVSSVLHHFDGTGSRAGGT